MKILVIVESPNKIAKIQGYLNQIGNHQYRVAATVGHLMDLEKEKSLGVDIDETGVIFTPKYIAIKDKSAVIRTLKQQAKQVDEVWIASDLDQEGEFIGYSICQLLKLDMQTTKRLIFNEITLNAITQAVESPQLLNQRLLAAQQARRISDRLIGFQLSQVARLTNRQLALGRVKTVLVRQVTERETAWNETHKLAGTTEFALTGSFSYDIEFNAHALETLPTTVAVRDYFASVSEFRVTEVRNQPRIQQAPFAFKTSSLQKDASRQLHVSPKIVLQLAQKLYEQGHISYPRTDTTNLPKEKIQEIRQLITEQYGVEYVNSVIRVETGDKKNTQGAHSAIYPTNLKVISLKPTTKTNIETKMTTKTNVETKTHVETKPTTKTHVESKNKSEVDLLDKLYHIIYTRTIASQMTSARYQQLIIKFRASDINWNKIFERLIFWGYLKIYQEPTETESDPVDNLPEQLLSLKKHDIITMLSLKATSTIPHSATLYDQTSILDKMDKLGIGRPSTWGQILQDCLDSKYIQEMDKSAPARPRITITYVNKQISEATELYQPNTLKKRLVSTEIGRLMTNYAQRHFAEIFSDQFTSELECQLTDIASGTLEANQVISQVYKRYQPKYHELMTEATEAKTEVRVPADALTDCRASAVPVLTGCNYRQRRLLGTYQNQPVYAFLNKKGIPLVQLGDFVENSEPDFRTIYSPLTVASITIDSVSELFKYPLKIGDYQDQPIWLKRAEKGFYVQCGKVSFSHDNSEVDLIAIQKQLQLSQEIQVPNSTIVIKQGKYGPYFMHGKKFISIPMEYHSRLDTVTAEQCAEWAPTKPKSIIETKPKTKITVKPKMQ